MNENLRSWLLALGATAGAAAGVAGASLARNTWNQVGLGALVGGGFGLWVAWHRTRATITGGA